MHFNQFKKKGRKVQIKKKKKKKKNVKNANAKIKKKKKKIASVLQWKGEMIILCKIVNFASLQNTKMSLIVPLRNCNVLLL